MGWSFMQREKNVSTQDFFQREFGDKVEILKTIAYNMGREVYMAIRVKETGEVFGMVCLCEWRPKDYFNFGYKEMDESMGPGCYNCPASILDMLTPTKHEYAELWRMRCRALLEQKKARPTMKVGAVVTFKEPVAFSNGSKAKALTIASLKPLRFVDVGTSRDGMFRYRISKYGLQTIDQVFKSEQDYYCTLPQPTLGKALTKNGSEMEVVALHDDKIDVTHNGQAYTFPLEHWYTGGYHMVE